MSRWAQYGFPDVTMMAGATPLEGLILALREREVAATGTAAKTDFEVPVPVALDYYSARLTMGRFDLALQLVAGQFVNHQAFSDVESWAENFAWDVPGLIAALASHPAFSAGYLQVSRDLLTPEQSAVWAAQRYLMVNMLRYLPIPDVNIDGIESYHTATTGAAAVSGVYASTPWPMGIFTPEYSQCPLFIRRKIGVNEFTASYQCVWNARIPDAYPLAIRQNARLKLDIIPAENGFDPFHTGLQPGINVVQADAIGRFFNAALPLAPEWPHDYEPPSDGQFFTYGFMTRHQAAADVTSEFEFYDGDPV